MDVELASVSSSGSSSNSSSTTTAPSSYAISERLEQRLNASLHGRKGAHRKMKGSLGASLLDAEATDDPAVQHTEVIDGGTDIRKPISPREQQKAAAVAEAEAKRTSTQYAIFFYYI
jgi:hypothetical protein